MKFSIVIPTRHRSQLLNRLLNIISNFNLGENTIEVVVIDNGDIKNEIDLTENICKIYSKRLNIRYYHIQKVGPSFARNSGYRKSRFRHIIFLDDDNILDTDYILDLEKVWKMHKGADAIGGKIYPKLRGGLPDYVNRDFEWVYAFQDYGNKITKLKYPYPLFSTNFSVFVKSKKRKTGLFDERLGRMYFGGNHFGGEDIELSRRLLLSGKKLYFNAKIKTFNVILPERINKFYYWRRIFKAGAEMKQVDIFLAEKFRNYHETLNPQILVKNAKIYLKNIMLWQNNKHSFFENLVYFIGYHMLGSVIIIIYRRKK